MLISIVAQATSSVSVLKIRGRGCHAPVYPDGMSAQKMAMAKSNIPQPAFIDLVGNTEYLSSTPTKARKCLSAT